MKNTLINLALFQSGWFVAVLLGDLPALAFATLALTIHAFVVMKTKAEWKLICLVVVAGCLWDALMAQLGILEFAGEPLLGIPLWLICLWVIFATTFMHCLSWMQGILWLSVVLAAVLGPASYWFGAQLSDTQIGMPVTTSLLVMSLGWALLFPAGIYYAGRLNEKN